MIARIYGNLMDIDGSMATIDVSGVGYEVEVSANVLQELPLLNEPITLFTHMVVREDAQLLFGFASKAERNLFRAFVRLNGVGPKLGLALISSLDLSGLATAVANHDIGMLTKVPGVGKKTAERIMLEMKSRIDELAAMSGVAMNVVSIDTQPGANALADEAEAALIALGYKPTQAAYAIAQVLAHAQTSPESVEGLVREALRSFAQAQSNSGPTA